MVEWSDETEYRQNGNTSKKNKQENVEVKTILWDGDHKMINTRMTMSMTLKLVVVVMMQSLL
jgi:TPP-dependent trihydroxycyclohexane-1,2-dione (THcHDO) dehydratase